MEVDPTIGDLDIHFPGAYLEESSSNKPLTSLTGTDTVLAEPVVQHRQIQKAPAQFWDILPEPSQAVSVSIPQPQLSTVYLMVTDPLTTISNSFGLFCQYLFHLLHDPDALVNPSDLSNLTIHTPPPLPLK